MHLSISIVAHKTDAQIFESTLDSLCHAVVFVKQHLSALSQVSLAIIDNDESLHANAYQSLAFFEQCHQDVFCQTSILHSETNDGYGAGHNLGLLGSSSTVHLVLNPDALLAEDAIVKALGYMQAHSSVALVCPQSTTEQGQPEYLCKRYPTVLDLLLRGFAPGVVKRLFVNRLDRYQMTELTDTDKPVHGVTIASGCCMFLRTEAVLQINGFNEQFFLYFEDFDLSIRLAQIGELVYLPEVNIVHYGGNAAKKGWAHRWMFISSAWRFFHLHGWRFL